MTTEVADAVSNTSVNPEEQDSPFVTWVDLLTWLGEGKRLIAACTACAIAVSVAAALLLPAVFTARTSLLPPSSQQPSAAAAAALSTLGGLGSLAGGLSGKSPDELYVALLRSDSVVRALDQRFDLKSRYGVKTFEALRKAISSYVRVSSDKKTGVIQIEVDDEEPEFAAKLANAHLDEIVRLLDRLAVSEAQQRRMFFAQQLKEAKEGLIVAETELQRVQEQTGVMALDKQSEAMITGIAQLRALIAEREVALKVLLTSATDANPDVMRLNSELRALRSTLARMESNEVSRSTGSSGSNGSLGIPIGKLPQVALTYVRARRDFKLQESLLEAMVRQFELAKLDEAREGPLLQQVDVATPPDYRSKPSRLFLVLVSAMLSLCASAVWVVVRRYAARVKETSTDSTSGWGAVRRAWNVRS
jgi:tyrosine-protein kinase Etk/Wzc